MIDFINMRVCRTTTEKWLKSAYLNFNTRISKETGEILSKSEKAKYNNLTFEIVYTATDQTEISYGKITGSLHHYYNHKKENHNDFTFSELQEVIQELKSKFYINPKTAKIHGLEIGLNIYTPHKVREHLAHLVAYKNKEFSTFKNPRTGKFIYATKWEFKIYDKGKLSKELKGVKNLMRLEMRYKKSEILKKKYNISTLDDLTKIEKIKPVISEILTRWNDIIYYDQSINLDHRTQKQKEDILSYGITQVWTGYNYEQRKRNKKKYRKLMSLYGSNIQNEIGELITKKWEELTTVEPQLKQPLHQECKNRPHQEQKHPKKRVCKCCGADISHKRKGAKYCSKKCNNKVNGNKRTKTHQMKRKQETKILKNLIGKLKQTNLSLTIIYKDTGGLTYCDHLKQNEIDTVPEWINRTVKVLIKSNKTTPPLELTTIRARQLIKAITNNNKRNGI